MDLSEQIRWQRLSFDRTNRATRLLVAALPVLFAWDNAGAIVEAAIGEQPAPCIMHLDLPAETKITVDGRGYGASRELSFKQLDPGKAYQSKLQIATPDGGIGEIRVNIRAGAEIVLTLDDFMDERNALAAWRHPATATRASSAAFSPDGKSVAVVGSDQKQALLFDAGSGKLLRRLLGHEQRIRGIAFSPSGRLLATCGEDNSIRIWNVASGERIRTISPPDHPQRAATPEPHRGGRGFRNLGEDIAADIAAGIGDVLDQALEPLRQRLSQVHSVVFSPDGRFLLSGQYDGSVRLWETSTGKQQLQYCGPTVKYTNAMFPVINTAAFSPDGQRVIAADERGYVRVWDRGSGRQLLRFWADEHDAVSAQYSPGADYILTLGADHVARIWDARSGKSLHLLYPGESGRIRVACFAPSGAVLTLGEDAAVRVWDPLTGDEIKRLPISPMFLPKDLLVVAPPGDSMLTEGMLGYQIRSAETGQFQRLLRTSEK